MIRGARSIEPLSVSTIRNRLRILCCAGVSLGALLGCSTPASHSSLASGASAPATFEPGSYELFACNRDCSLSGSGDAFLIGAAVFRPSGPGGGTGCLTLLQIDALYAPTRGRDTTFLIRWTAPTADHFQWTVVDPTTGLAQHTLPSTIRSATAFEVDMRGNAWPSARHPSSRVLLAHRRAEADSLPCAA